VPKQNIENKYKNAKLAGENNLTQTGKGLAVFFVKQIPDHVDGDVLHDCRFIPETSPEELTVVGPVSRASQCLCQTLYGDSVGNGDSHNQAPEVLPCSVGEMVFERFEKTFEFSGYVADCSRL
jgi:hypothetical protein